LKRLGELLLNRVRDTDIIARYGGEEIAILLPQTGASCALDLAERLRQAVETSIMVPADEDNNTEAITITVSLGVTGLDRQVSDSQIFIQRADEALYQAKSDGRNRVIAFHSKEL
jgi:diguanylate cyclase (GGDEF)-like protein